MLVSSVRGLPKAGVRRCHNIAANPWQVCEDRSISVTSLAVGYIIYVCTVNH
ncbi:hypothetical protein Hanom_Chr00s063860g01786211 [Helianthus anomalus]